MSMGENVILLCMEGRNLFYLTEYVIQNIHRKELVLFDIIQNINRVKNSVGRLPVEAMPHVTTWSTISSTFHRRR